MWSIRFSVVSSKLNASCNILLILGKCKRNLCISLRTRTFFWSSLLLQLLTFRVRASWVTCGVNQVFGQKKVLKLQLTTLLNESL